MEIIRIYNNNAVVALDDNGEEIIVTGKGLAFGKKSGDYIESHAAEKIFILKDKQMISKLEELLKETPAEYVAIVDDIISMLHKQSRQEVSNNIYFSLIDHIRISLEREKKGIIITNPLVLEIKQYYSEEYTLACKAADIIHQHLALKISEDEIGFIALHIVNATMTDRFEDTMLITKMIQDTVHYVERYFNLEMNKETVKYVRFVRHLQFFARRVITGTDSEDDDDILYRMGRQEYPEAYICVRQLVAQLVEKYHHMPSQAEQGYLVYHIQNLLSENRRQ